MLVLSRKSGERIKIGDNVWVTVVQMNGRIVRLGIEAPEDLIVLRGELTEDAPPELSPIPPKVLERAERRDSRPLASIRRQLRR